MSSYVPVESLLASSAFRRLLVVSLVGHVAMFLALVLRPSSRATMIASAPVMVTMVDMPKPAPAPPAAKPPAPKPPEAKPKPPPEPEPPPKPVVKEIVIPKEPAPLQRPKPVPVTPPPSAEELLAKMTQKVEQQEAAKAPPAPPVEATETAAAAVAPSAGLYDPLMSPWMARVQVKVQANWSGASVCEGKAKPIFNVDIDASGHLSNIDLVESSGDSFCDSTGDRALRKSDPVPPPPRAGEFALRLNPPGMSQ